jgi:hypothetical protein
MPTNDNSPIVTPNPGPEPPTASTSLTLNGRIVDLDAKTRLSGLPVFAFTRNGEDELTPVGVSQSDQRGTFSLSIPRLETPVFLRVPGTRNLEGSEDLPVPMDMVEGGAVAFPVKVDPDGIKTIDTDTIDVPPVPDTTSLAAPTSVFSQDLGTGTCVRLTTPNRSLEEFTYLTVVRLTEPNLNKARARLAKAANWDVALDSRIENESMELGYGHLLRFRQSWKAHGYTLGDLLYSLPLAPGQKKQIAVVDWERREAASRTETAELRDQLTNSLVRDRDVSDIVRATLVERLQGSSLSIAGGQATGAAGAGSGSAQQSSAVGGSVGGVASTFGGGGLGYTTAGQEGKRDLAASELQRIHDATMQAASSVRSLRSTVVQTVTQTDTTKAMTEVVANHNHCHAMTIQYFEVLRHFLVEHTLDAVSRCVFVPLDITPFTRDRARAWREIVEPRLLDPSVADGFEAADRAQRRSTEFEFDDQGMGELVTSIVATLEVVFRIARPQEHFTSYGVLNPLEGNFLATGRDHAQAAEGETSGRWQPLVDLINDDQPPGPGQKPWVYDFDRTHYFFNSEGQMTTKADALDWPLSKREEDFQAEIAPKVAAAFVRFLTCQIKEDGQPDIECRASLVEPFQPNTPLRVVVRTLSPVNAEWTSIKKRFFHLSNSRPLPFGSQVIVKTIEVHATTDDHRGVLLNKTDLDLDLVPRKGEPTVSHVLQVGTDINRVDDEDERRVQRLVDHLNAHAEHYHVLLWQAMDERRRFLLLDGILEPINQRSLASVVENRLVAVVGNSLVFPMVPGAVSAGEVKEQPPSPQQLLEQFEDRSLAPTRVSLPTRGVFAEAMLGECNSCEAIDDSRLWKWSEAPIDEPTPIQPVSTESRATPTPDLKPSGFPASLINIQSPPQFPDPTGLTAALELLGRLGAFRDVTFGEQTAKNAIEAFKTASEGAQALAADAAELAKAEAMRRGGFDKTLDAAKKATKDGLVQEDDAKKVVGDALNSMVPKLSSDQNESLLSEPPVQSAAASVAEQGGELDVQRQNERVSVKTPGGGQPRGSRLGVERVLTFVSTYPGTSTPVEGTYYMVLKDTRTGERYSDHFDIAGVDLAGQIATRLPAGEWEVVGYIDARISRESWEVPVNHAIPGLGPISFSVASGIAAEAISLPKRIVEIVSVEQTTKFIDLRLEAVLQETKVDRTIELSASPSAELTGEVKSQVDAKLNTFLKELIVSGVLGLGGKLGLSVAAAQKLTLTITYQRVTDFKVVKVEQK